MANGLDPDAALEILKLALDDIERIKQQQWRDFYAVLAVQAGLLVLYRDYRDFQTAFIIASIIVWLLGAYLLGSSQVTLETKFRARKNRALGVLGKAFSDTWGGIDEPSQSRTYPILSFIVLSAVTAFIVYLIHS
jgi:hypothetical protein